MSATLAAALELCKHPLLFTAWKQHGGYHLPSPPQVMEVMTMATSPDARASRLMSWIDEQFAGNIAAFCRYYGLKPAMASYLYQVKSDTRSFGERAARNLEKATGRPEGWLDAPPPQTGTTPISYDEALCSRLPAGERHLIEDFIRLVLLRNDLVPITGNEISVFLRRTDSRAAVATPIATDNDTKRAFNFREPDLPPAKRQPSSRAAVKRRSTG